MTFTVLDNTLSMEHRLFLIHTQGCQEGRIFFHTESSQIPGQVANSDGAHEGGRSGAEVAVNLGWAM